MFFKSENIEKIVRIEKKSLSILKHYKLNPFLLRHIILILFIPFLSYIFFGFTDVPTSEEQVLSFSFNFLSFLVCLLCVCFSLHLANKIFYSFWTTLFFVLSFFTFSIIFHFNVFDFKINEYLDIIYVIPYLWIPISIWYIGFITVILIEKKARPELFFRNFALMKVWFFLILIIISNYYFAIDLIENGTDNFDKRIDDPSFSFKILSIISLLICLLLIPFISFWKKDNRIISIGKKDKTQYQKFFIPSLILVLNIPIAIWAFYWSFDLKYYENNNIIFLTLIQFFLILLLLVFTFFKKTEIASSTIYSFVFSFILVLIWIFKLAFDVYLNTNFLSSFSISVISTLLISILLYFKLPKMSKWIYNGFMFFCLTNNFLLIATWILNYYNVNIIDSLPFRIDIMFSLSLLFTPLSMTSYSIFKIILISYTILKLNRYVNEENEFNKTKNTIKKQNKKFILEKPEGA